MGPWRSLRASAMLFMAISPLFWGPRTTHHTGNYYPPPRPGATAFLSLGRQAWTFHSPHLLTFTTFPTVQTYFRGPENLHRLRGPSPQIFVKHCQNSLKNALQLWLFFFMHFDMEFWSILLPNLAPKSTKIGAKSMPRCVLMLTSLFDWIFIDFSSILVNPEHTKWWKLIEDYGVFWVYAISR